MRNSGTRNLGDTRIGVDVASDKNERTLLMLTNQYPSACGDSAFISNEIDYLAERFDEIYIWSYARPSEPTLPIPQNVHYVGSMNMPDALRTTPLRSSVRVVTHTLGLVLRDLQAKAIHNPRQLLRAIKHGFRASLSAQEILTATKIRGIRLEDAHLYSFWGMNCGLPVANLGGTPRTTSVRLHGYDLYEERSGGYIPFRGSLFRSTDLILPISEDGASYVRSRYPEYSDKISVQRLGTQDRGIGPSPEAGVARVVSCSYVIPVKRVPLIFRTLQIVARAHPIEWVHFGGGPGLSVLQQLIDSEGYDGLTISLKGSVPNDEVLSFYRSTPVNVFLNLSESEGVPVSIMEAMSFGIPIVATNVGGVSELLNGPERPGVLVGANPSPSESAEAVQQVLRHREVFDPRQRWLRMSSSSDLTESLVARMIQHTDRS